MSFVRLRILLLAVGLLLLAGCGSAPRRGAEVAQPQPVPGYVPLSDAQAVQQALLGHYREWKGVPYRYGGSDRRGLDCSGFTQITYRERFGILLPRDSSAQRAAGRAVPPSVMAPGDLLFFNTGLRTRHVGIYFGNRRFLHVSERAGVMLSSLEEGYWGERFQEAVRIVID